MLIPDLTPSGGREVEAALPVGVPPPIHPTPRRFRALVGSPRNVAFLTALRMNPKGFTAAQKAGMRYEAQAHMFLANELGDKYQASAALSFEDDSGHRIVVPDGLYFSPYGTALIFEVKRQHCPEAWWQLRRLYSPVVSAFPFVNRVSCIEVTRSYDPSMGFPEDAMVVRSVREAIEAPAQPLKVLVYRP